MPYLRRYNAELAFMSEDTHNWKGEYGALRRELLVFTLAELNRIIAELRHKLFAPECDEAKRILE